MSNERHTFRTAPDGVDPARVPQRIRARFSERFNTWTVKAAPGMTLDALRAHLAEWPRDALVVAGENHQPHAVPPQILERFGGVLERFPGLKICLSHGGGQLPFLIGRFDHALASAVAELATDGSGRRRMSAAIRSMARPAAAARRPAPIAWITVAAPVTMSPPANTPAMEVARFSSVSM